MAYLAQIVPDRGPRRFYLVMAMPTLSDWSLCGSEGGASTAKSNRGLRGYAKEGMQMSPDGAASVNWVPIAGQWLVQGTDVVFQGPTAPRLDGLILSSSRLRAGSISVTVCPSTIAHRDFAARVVIGQAKGHYFSVGLGGYGFAYVIDVYSEGQGWRALSADGFDSNLRPNADYRLQVGLKGQNLALAVDGITVLDGILPYPLRGAQTGLFAWGNDAIRFTDFSIEPEKPRVFIVMKFEQPYDTLYEHVVKKVAEDLDLRVLRADEILRPGDIMQDIIREIILSDIIIAEISSDSPNVYYEIGYAHAVGKPTILLANREYKPPFDIQGARQIRYSDTISGKNEVEAALREHLHNIRAEWGAD